MKHELVIVLDFGGQYNQLIARRVRENSVYCEIKSYKTPIEELRALSPKGIIFTGGPNSVYDPASPHISKEIFELGVPILGICYGCQLMAYTLGGEVSACDKSEYGKIDVTVDNKESLLFSGIPEHSVVWMSHTDYVSRLPEGFINRLNSASNGSLTLSGEAADIDAGFILKYGGIEQNCSFDAVFAGESEYLSDRAGRLLF